MIIVFVAVLVLHGAIHLLGFFKSIRPASIKVMVQPIPRLTGFAWLLVTAMFWLAAVFLMLDVRLWWLAAAMGLLLSQALIISRWKDARYGTLFNIVIALAVVVGFSTWQFRNAFEADVQDVLKGHGAHKAPLADTITTAELSALPPLVRRYLEYTNTAHGPRIQNVHVWFRGEIRKKDGSDWMPFNSEQYNTIEPAARLFFMDAVMSAMPVAGYHHYVGGKASMDVRLFSMFTVQQQSGRAMDVAETVTFFNDMCLMAPGSLVDKRITWGATNGDTVHARFTDRDLSVTAALVFNANGALSNFISLDRGAAQADGSLLNLTWSTPITAYSRYGSHLLPSTAHAVYTYPDGDFTYGIFELQDIRFNEMLLD